MLDDVITTSAHEAVMVGSSEDMQRLCDQVRKIASTDVPALIQGPIGSGKEAAARSIHRQSARREAPFTTISCATTGPAELLSRIVSAQGGTLFLDDIDDAPADTQSHLLRLLQEKTVARPGEEPQAIDVRVIAATRNDPVQAIGQGRLREDLYYRINVVSFIVPPLAERRQDIEDIARFYFSRFAGVHNRSLRGFSKTAMLCLLAHDWPGNVRELINRVQRAVLMAQGRFIQASDLGLDPRSVQQPLSLEDARAAAESAVIRRALSQSRNQISRAANLLGISRVTLYRLIDKYRLRAEQASMESELEEEASNPA